MVLAKRVFIVVAGSFFFFGAVLLFSSLSGITGYAVFEGSDYNLGIYAAIWFFAAGAVVLLALREYERSRVENEAHNLLERRKILTKADELKRLARKMGYEVEEGRDHTTIYDERHRVVTQIPRHREIKRHTAREAMYRMERAA